MQGSAFQGNAFQLGFSANSELPLLSELFKIYHANDVQLRLQIVAHLNTIASAINALNELAVLETDISTVDMDFVIDEDSFVSNLDTQVPTQQSVKAYVDAQIDSVSAAGLGPWQEAGTGEMGGRYAYFDIISASPIFYLPASFEAVSTLDQSASNEIWVWNANADTLFIVKITPASGDQIYMNGVSLGIDKIYSLQPGEMAILAPIADNSVWNMVVIGKRTYTPAMMKYGGSADYYSLAAVSTTGNKITVTGEIRCIARAGIGARWLMVAHGGTLNSRRVNVQIGDSSNATYPDRIALICRTAVGSVCVVSSGFVVTDGKKHTFLLDYDGDNGTSVVCVDGITTGHVITTLTTGTINSGSLTFEYGFTTLTAGTDYDGEMGYVGYMDNAGLDYQDFFTADGRPLEINEITWGGWISQPTIWNPHGQLTNNVGTVGDFTKNGTIDPVIQYEQSSGLYL